MERAGSSMKVGFVRGDPRSGARVVKVGHEIDRHVRAELASQATTAERVATRHRGIHDRVASPSQHERRDRETEERDAERAGGWPGARGRGHGVGGG